MTDTTSLAWSDEIRSLTPEAKELFENYSGITSDEVKPHIKNIRAEAYKIHPYPCLATFAFLELMVTQSPQYPEILERLKNGDTFLDMGCCVGQDIRKLVHDGAPSKNAYGSDIEQGFWDMGYDLFLDKSTLKTTFIAADVFDPESELKTLDGKIDIIHAASFLHLFSLAKCTEVVRRMIKLFKYKNDCLFVGCQLGRVRPGPSGKDKYRHNAESFAEMWKEIGEETGTKWVVDVKLGEVDLYLKAEKMGVRVDYLPEGSRWLNFTVRKVA